ncbi:Major facilitator-type transporter ecdD [Fusarium oxysporum f. sp. albedinis]|nr:Major facilitator-type transporter ecdD [Fusarium oxysporum f. sp. albedinis]
MAAAPRQGFPRHACVNAVGGYDPCCWPRTWSRVEAAIAEGLQIMFFTPKLWLVYLMPMFGVLARGCDPATAEHLYQATIYTRLLLIIICLSVIQIPAFA